MADDLAARADRLLALWSQLSVQHVSLGAACACGTGGVSLRLDDFELDIVDYLEDAAQRSGVAAVAAWFEQLGHAGRPMRPGRPAGPARPLVHLLEAIHRGDTDEAVAGWLLPRLERTLENYASEHGPRQPR